MIRPHMEFGFDHVLSHINTVFVLITRQGVLNTDEFSDPQTDLGDEKQQMRLKGKSLFLKKLN